MQNYTVRMNVLMLIRIRKIKTSQVTITNVFVLYVQFCIISMIQSSSPGSRNAHGILNEFLHDHVERQLKMIKL